MQNDSFHLLKTCRFLPLFITQFLSAFNDNAFKNALVILITYQIGAASSIKEQFLVTLAAGLFILPFFLFSATAGQLSDKYEKTILIRIVKFFEIVFMSLAVIGFYHSNIALLMLTLFLMGVHSAFFGPLKYAILPEQLAENELIGGNALIGAGTFIAILLGTIIGGTLILTHAGTMIVSILVLLVALGGWLSSFFIPSTTAAMPQLKISLNFIAETWQIIKNTQKHHNIFLAILGISWFWLVGYIFITQFPNLTKNVLGANSHIITLFLTLFTIGIAVGSLTCNRLLKGELTAKYVPISILAMTLFMVDLYYACNHIIINNSGNLIGIGHFLLSLTNWRIMIDMFLISVFGGLYVVPLYALIQAQAPVEIRARVIACNNIINSLFMVASAIITMIMLAINFTIPQIFLILGILNFVVACYICKLLPHALFQSVLKWILILCYKVKISGLENYKAAGNRVVIIANHLSFIDVVLLTAFLPDKFLFAINTQIAKRWWMQPILPLVDAFIMDPTNPMAAKPLIKKIREDRKCVIFPEGRITTTGSLMKVYEGPGMIADKSNAVLLPIRIEGAQYTIFSRLRGKIKLHWFPKISLTILPPRRFEVPADIKGRKRRQIISGKLYDIMSDMMFESSNYHTTLFQSLIDARKVRSGKQLIVEDIERKPMNYNQLIARSFILGDIMSQNTRKGESVGILLPNTIATLVTFFGLQAFGRVPVMLNFSAGPANLASACQTAQVNFVYTSHRFVDAARLQPSIERMIAAGVTIIYLEDLRNKVNIIDKLKGLIRGRFANYAYRKISPNILPTDPAVILFTSGSEGAPKGVVLSHQNVEANRYQVTARVPFTTQDSILNALPLFHSFGLTVATLLPVFSGIKIFLYPSPLHYRIVPELIYDTNATMTFGTDTFLSGYARYAHPYDFYNIKYVFAGAEKLKDETRKTWMEKFGVRIIEGYGATETSPIITANTTMQNKCGTVGRFLPAINYRLESVPGINNGGRLLVAGPNIMMGYLLASQPGRLIPPENGWYDTGDVVAVDEQGYVTILDRVKRFAKIGGEMVSLTAIENYIAELWPDNHHAAINIPDIKKGEQVILITNHKNPSRDEIVAYARGKGISELSIPRRVVYLDKVPVLATGKINYVELKNWVNENLDKLV
jgi:acyl-[acyl-carrier-protein]-phospholipid O-acyltransferase/long-chain-fatty-acid--[acyl-carrier-protein] ligase